MDFKYRNFCIIFLFYLIFLPSCITRSKIRYLQKKGKTEETEFNVKQVEYRVQTGDNLYIRLSSNEPQTNQALSIEVRNYSQTPASKYIDIYCINSQGNIKVPQIGEMNIEGYTTQQIKDSIELIIKEYYPQAIVDVRLADNYITILGDVYNPGRYLVDFREKITIFELIGMAGDLKYEANRKEVKLIRKNGNESVLITTIDLTKRDIVEGQFYYLVPNDVVYVEPLRAVSLDNKSFPFSSTLALILSVTTSIIVLISQFK